MGAPRGSEVNWLAVRPVLFTHVKRALPSVDPTYDPDGDGTLSDAEVLAWTPTERPKRVQMRTLRKQDVSGGIGKPLLIGHGTLDFVVSTSESVGYKELVEKVLGPDLAAQLLRVYLLPGVGHNPIVLQTAFLNAAIDAVDAWVETGTPPGALAGATLEQPAFRRDDENHDHDRGDDRRHFYH
jgi:pimeloyl-ACP methyl ester carboxylesterase